MKWILDIEKKILIGYDILNNKYGRKKAIAMVNNLFIADVPPKNGEQNEKPANKKKRINKGKTLVTLETNILLIYVVRW